MARAGTMEFTEPGTVVTIRRANGRGKVTATVGSSCGSNAGTWWCLTHQRGFRNNMERDGHTYDGEHLLTWVCHEHGPETP